MWWIFYKQTHTQNCKKNLKLTSFNTGNSENSRRNWKRNLAINVGNKKNCSDSVLWKEKWTRKHSVTKNLEMILGLNFREKQGNKKSNKVN